MKVFHHRGFLNRKEGMAAFEASIHRHSYKGKKDGKRHTSWDADFSISDCFRKVTLDFSDRKEAIRKMDLLVRELQAFRRKLKREHGRFRLSLKRRAR